MQRLRLFIALEVPQQIQLNIVKNATQHLSDRETYRLLTRHNLHITVKFLGDTQTKDVPVLIHILEFIARTNTASSVIISSYGFLPPTRPRTVNRSIQKSTELDTLHSALDKALAEEGVALQEWRQYNPHITLARTKNIVSDEEQKRLHAAQPPPLEFFASTLTLFDSELRQNGAHYAALQRVKLS